MRQGVKLTRMGEGREPVRSCALELLQDAGWGGRKRENGRGQRIIDIPPSDKLDIKSYLFFLDQEVLAA